MEPIYAPDTHNLTRVDSDSCVRWQFSHKEVWVFERSLDEEPICRLDYPVVPMGFHGTWKAGKVCYRAVVSGQLERNFVF